MDLNVWPLQSSEIQSLRCLAELLQLYLPFNKFQCRHATIHAQGSHEIVCNPYWLQPVLDSVGRKQYSRNGAIFLSLTSEVAFQCFMPLLLGKALNQRIILLMSLTTDFTSLRGCKPLIDRRRKHLIKRNLAADDWAHSSSGVANRVMYCHIWLFYCSGQEQRAEAMKFLCNLAFSIDFP